MATATTALGPQESLLVGRWLDVQGSTQSDAVAKRIDILVSEYLVRVAATPDGWDVLFRDPADSRLWELTYLSSESHAGGPPRLAVIAGADAAQKYGAVVPSNKSLERTRER